MKVIFGIIIGIIITIGTLLVYGKEILFFISQTLRKIFWQISPTKKRSDKIALEFEMDINEAVDRFSLGDELISST